MGLDAGAGRQHGAQFSWLLRKEIKATQPEAVLAFCFSVWLVKTELWLWSWGELPKTAQRQVEGSYQKVWGDLNAASGVCGAMPVLAVDATCDLCHIAYPIHASIHPAVKWD